MLAARQSRPYTAVSKSLAKLRASRLTALSWHLWSRVAAAPHRTYSESVVHSRARNGLPRDGNVARPLQAYSRKKEKKKRPKELKHPFGSKGETVQDQVLELELNNGERTIRESGLFRTKPSSFFGHPKGPKQSHERSMFPPHITQSAGANLTRSVVLGVLPRFTTVSDLSRLATFVGVQPREVAKIAVFGLLAPSGAPEVRAKIYFTNSRAANLFMSQDWSLKLAATSISTRDSVSTIRPVLRPPILLPFWSNESSFDFQVTKMLAKPTSEFPVEPGLSRWLTFRVPGPNFPLDTSLLKKGPRDEEEAKSADEDGEDESEVSIALRKALARERALEDELIAARRAMLHEMMEMIKATANVQVRQDLAGVGGLEGVWIRMVECETKDGDKPSSSMYELHAMVAFCDCRDAARALDTEGIRLPAYRNCGISAVTKPWPEALDPDFVSELTVDRMDGVVESNLQAQKLEAERDRQRGVAEGTWGKETLSELKERMMRSAKTSKHA
ncbi:unnamed protein product [Mycena citricolor]|uniref:Uncharacterized protein n=1 Tax=Mycena citricolor TaxID=2018698 RepID=A0AAD2HU69_9AGAR|nr:unnamed protein product [Mycena citricolor]